MPGPAGAFDASREPALLSWAAAYLAEQADLLERSHADVYGRIRCPETRVEIKFLREWVRRVEQLVPGASDREVIFIPEPVEQLPVRRKFHLESPDTAIELGASHRTAWRP
jgi:hypothetical protein